MVKAVVHQAQAQGGEDRFPARPSGFKLVSERQKKD